MPAETDPRPLWFLAPGGIPVRSDSKRPPAGIAWQAREARALAKALSDAADHVDAANPAPKGV